MADLQLDFERFAAARDSVDDVRARFSAASESTRRAATHVGHRDLEARVRDFSDGWDKRRDELSERLAELSDAIEAIADTFLTLDQKLAKGISLDGHVPTSPLAQASPRSGGGGW